MTSYPSPATVAVASRVHSELVFVAWVAPIRCPRCLHLSPVLDFRPDHDVPDVPEAHRRCRTCRGGFRRFTRDQALASGICEARDCAKPIAEHPTETAKCEHHAAASADFHSRRDVANAADGHIPARERRERDRHAATATPAP